MSIFKLFSLSVFSCFSLFSKNFMIQNLNIKTLFVKCGFLFSIIFKIFDETKS